MAIRIYGATALTGGGTGALDKINGGRLNDQDRVIVILNTGMWYSFYLDATSALSESSPDIIRPDSNAGNKRWILLSWGWGRYIPTIDIVDSDVTIAYIHYAKSIRMRSAANRTAAFPSVGAAEDGLRITFIKGGAGRVTIQAADVDIVADSSAGGTIYNDVAGEIYATITLEYVHAVVTWVIVGAHGTWVTT